jgi:hypothetical protein
MIAPRYLRFAQALLLTATTLPACSGADHPSSPPGPSGKTETVGKPQASPPGEGEPASSLPSSPAPSDSTPAGPGPVADPGSDDRGAVDASPSPEASSTENDAAAPDAEEVDSRVPFSSGPIVPPELPECFA